APPVHESACSSVGTSVRVRYPYRDLLPAITPEQRLYKQVRLHLIPAQPRLVQVDFGVVKDSEAVGLEAARRVGHTLADRQPRQQGKYVDEQQPVPRHVDLRAARSEA